MIEYETIEGRRGIWQILVRLDGKITGRIKLVEGGFRYFPKGSRKGLAGELFKSVSEVQVSLESDDDRKDGEG
jgi:hypothetical protein